MPAPGVSPHLVGLGVVTFVTLACCIIGKLARTNSPDNRRIDQTLGSLAIGTWVVIGIWYLLPQNFDITRSLPLHVCDLTGLIAPVAVLTRQRCLRAILFFWGFGLCTQALMTPTTDASPQHAEFWCFWALHAQIIGLAVFDFVIRRFRPTWADYQFMLILGSVYVVVLIPLNLVLDSNYAYVGPVEVSTTTLLAFLGPYPWRIPVICLLAFLAQGIALAVGRCIPVRSS